MERGPMTRPKQFQGMKHEVQGINRSIARAIGNVSTVDLTGHSKVPEQAGRHPRSRVEVFLCSDSQNMGKATAVTLSHA